MNRELTVVKSCLNLASKNESIDRKQTGDVERKVAGSAEEEEEKLEAEPNDSRSFIIYQHCRFKNVCYEMVRGTDGRAKHSACFRRDNKSVCRDFKRSSRSGDEKLASDRTFRHREPMNSTGEGSLGDRDYTGRSKVGVLGQYSKKTRSDDCRNSEVENLERPQSEYRTKCRKFDGTAYYSDKQQPRKAAATLTPKRQAKFDHPKSRADIGNERAKSEGWKLQVAGRYPKFDYVKSRLDNRNERTRPQGCRLKILGRYPKFDYLKSRLDNRNDRPRPIGHRLKEYKGPYRDFSHIKPRVPTVAPKKPSNKWPPPNDDDEYYEEIGLVVGSSPINENGDLLVPLQQRASAAHVSGGNFIEPTDDGIKLLESLKLLHRKDAYYARKVNNIGIACWKPDTDRTLNFDQIKQFNQKCA